MTNEEAIRLVDDRMCYGRGKWSKHHQPVIDEYWQAGEMAIKALEAELHWIPVTERLPEEEGEYLVTDDAGGVKNIEVDMLLHYEDSGEPFWLYSQNAIAWAELPEPYKGVTE